MGSPWLLTSGHTGSPPSGKTMVFPGGCRTRVFTTVFIGNKKNHDCSWFFWHHQALALVTFLSTPVSPVHPATHANCPMARPPGPLRLCREGLAPARSRRGAVAIAGKKKMPGGGGGEKGGGGGGGGGGEFVAARRGHACRQSHEGKRSSDAKPGERV